MPKSIKSAANNSRHGFIHKVILSIGFIAAQYNIAYAAEIDTTENGSQVTAIIINGRPFNRRKFSEKVTEMVLDAADKEGIATDIDIKALDTEKNFISSITVTTGR